MIPTQFSSIFVLLRSQATKVRIVVIALLAVLVLTEPRAERYGDRYQWVLPTLALGCSAVNGTAVEYFGRFLMMEVILHGSKNGLGDRPINTRPNGNDRGFPSGHTTAAVFGASSLVSECIEKNPWVKTAVIVAAGFTGASRIEAEKHDIWQVLAGVILGLLTERAFRGKPIFARFRKKVNET